MADKTFNFERYGFENLEIWQLGMQIVHEVYRICRKFPKDEHFALSDQFRRAATSIVLNIAEGTGKNTKKDFSLFLHHAKGSLLECIACKKIAVQEGFVTESDTEVLSQLFEKEYFKLLAFNKSLSRKI